MRSSIYPSSILHHLRIDGANASPPIVTKQVVYRAVGLGNSKSGNRLRFLRSPHNYPLELTLTLGNYVLVHLKNSGCIRVVTRSRIDSTGIEQ